VAGEVSCRAIRPLFRYLNERALPLTDFLADLSLEARSILSPENWLSAAQFAELLDRASVLSGDPDLVAHVGAAAGEPCPFGPLSPQAELAGSPEALLEQAGDFLGLLERDGQVVVRTCRPGHAVIECRPPAGTPRTYHACTYARHLLGQIPHLWHIEGVQVRETHCAVPPAEMRSAGNRCTADAEGTVWEVSGQDGAAARLRLGQLQADGTFLWNGTLYGADCCVYEIDWPVPRKGWRRVLPWLTLDALLRRPVLRQIRHQRRVIQALREQLNHLNLTVEARILERTEELRAKARQMALVEQASRRFASLQDPPALFHEAVRTLREEFGYFTVSLHLLAGENWTLQALDTGDNMVQERPGLETIAQPKALERLRRAGRPLSQDDLTEQSHPVGLPVLGRGRSSLTAPLVASDRLLGVLDLQSPRRQRFDKDDALIVFTLATQVALTLERSQLYREEQRARQRADAMAVLARVVSTSLERDRVLSLALDQVRRVLPYDAAAILLLEDNQRILAASQGLPPHAEEALNSLFDPEERGPLARTLQASEPFPLTLAEESRSTFPTVLGPFSSWLAVPLTSRGTVVGTFLLAARRPRVYGKQDLRTAEDFAGQVSTAIENARLYDRIRHDRDRLETLYRTARELNADLEIEEVLRHILDLAQNSVGALGGTIIILDSAGRPTHSIILRQTDSPGTILREVLTRGAAGQALREQQGLLIHDTATDPRWLTIPDDPTRSAIVIPLLGQGRVIGILTVVHPQVGWFDADDLDLLSSIAGQASTVVQRAHLFAAIRDERARLEAVIEGTADAVIVLDEQGHVFRLNRSAADLFGLQGHTTAGDRPLDLILEHPALQELLRPSEVRSERKREVPLPDGRTFHATLTPIPGVGAAITMHDISYLKELDRMKSDFVANVSHDLRTPLGTVQGFAEMLELAGPLNEDQTRFVQQITHNVDSMSVLVEDLLDLAKIEAGVEMGMAPCQLAAVIAESVDQMAGPALLKHGSLQVQVPDDLPLVWGNGRRLGQVVNNLLDNAIKYAPAHGQVLLRASLQDDGVQVDISDNGPGIPAADLPHIFEKFYRAREGRCQARGSGLGLSIAHSIIQAHRGRIWAESREGVGTTISFRVPVWAGEDQDR
jgi:PAS domain S-box-containing protein